MSQLVPEPIHARTVHHPQRHHVNPVHPRLANVDALVTGIQQQFPTAQIRVTGRGRTVERQAELMAERRLANRHQFLSTYRPATHITEMDHWVAANPHATQEQATAAFADIIRRAGQRGVTVSNHLTDRARDISIPQGTPQFQEQVKERIRALGGHVIDEHDAVGGAHWHVDY